jgi:ribonuclease PH
VKLKRHDNRRYNQLRPVRFSRKVLSWAEGSALVEVGKTKVICSASFEEKVPNWRRGSGHGWITAEYAMLPRATPVRNIREASQGRVSGRTQEIQRLIGRSVRSVVDLTKLGGENTIWLDCDVIEADGGTRTAAVTGAFIAVYEALNWMIRQEKIEELPIKSFLAAVSVGIIEGQCCLDLDYFEDSQAQVDMNLVATSKGQLVEIQGTAENQPFSEDQLLELVALAKSGINQLIEKQKSLLIANEANNC